jgi:CubicO group peptidase (beta-lactamase class C family)
MKGEPIQVQGVCQPGYEAVAEAFERNFTEYGEIGASVSVVRDGEIKVHLWAGTRDKDQQLPWLKTTAVNIFSAGKPLSAVAALQLVAQGKLSLDAPIADYWPEFATAGKESITLRQVLSHRSGVNAFHPRIDDADIYDWQKVITHIEREQPWWAPGSEQGYSPMLYGWIVGEVVRRVSGADSFNQVFQQNLAQPLGMNCVFGVSQQQLEQIADVVPLKVSIPQTGSSNLVELMQADPRGVINQAFSNPPSLMFGTNSPSWRQAQIPGANAHGSADALATFYGALVNRNAPEAILPRDFTAKCFEEQSRAQDKVLATDLGFSLGFMLLPGDTESDPQARVCGHAGAGGCFGFADDKYGIGFGYATRAMGASILVDYRAGQLQQAVYQSLRGIDND